MKSPNSHYWSELDVLATSGVEQCPSGSKQRVRTRRSCPQSDSDTSRKPEVNGYVRCPKCGAWATGPQILIGVRAQNSPKSSLDAKQVLPIQWAEQTAFQVHLRNSGRSRHLIALPLGLSASC